MKLFRKFVTMLCALALVLTLAPAAFATEDCTIKIEGMEHGKDDGNGNQIYEAEEGKDVFVPARNGIGVNSGSGTATVTVDGILTNQGTVGIYGATGSELTATGGIKNSGMIDVDSMTENTGISSVTTDGTLTNQASGQLFVFGDSEATLTAKSGIENSKFIQVRSDGGTATVTTDGTLTNQDDGYLFVQGNSDVALTAKSGIDNSKYLDVSSYSGTTTVTTDGTLTNQAGGSLYVEGNSGAILTANSGIENSDYISVDGGNGTATVTTGDLTNKGRVIVSGKAGSKLTVTGDWENHGTIKASEADMSETGINYGTMNVNGNTYYGFNYVDDGGNIVGTALENWKDGKSDAATVNLKANEETREGWAFGGWQIGGQIYQPGEHTFTVSGITSITALWNAILKQSAPAPSGSDWTPGEPEKKGEEIKEVLDLRVLDADRKELTKVDDFYLVARTTRDRLIVLFTDVQLKNLPSGENLFYIILPDGTEVEYTLSIA